MVPPPDNLGDEFPDFDSMTPEEQMAWLESLAKRQGAKLEELTTSADYEIAEVSADVVIDEPGYVPFSMSDKPRHEERDEEPQPVVREEPEPEFEPATAGAMDGDAADEWDAGTAEDEEVFSNEPAWAGMAEDEAALASEPAWPDSAEDEAGVDEAVMVAEDESDPMQWLDSLAAHPDEELGTFDLLGEPDEPEYEEEPVAFDAMVSAEPEPDLAARSEALDFERVAFDDKGYDEDESVDAAEAELAFADDFDLDALLGSAAEAGSRVVDEDEELLGGADPMLWLESLAARQGANPEELLTTADLEVDEVPGDVVIDEPGYVPFDVVDGGPKATQTEPLEAGDAADEVERLETEAIAEKYKTSEASKLKLSDEEAGLIDGADPMQWLESLAKRQGARSDELTTTADLEIPELPDDTVVDEPGYVAYSPFDKVSVEDEQEDVSPVAAGVEADIMESAAEDLEVAEGEGEEALAWLEDLAAESGDEMLALLEFDEGAEQVEAEAAVSSDDPLAGMSDEEIAYAQAHGELTPHQELAWLKRQAAKLADVREDHLEEVVEEVPLAEVAPAEPAELPPWLQQMREASAAVDETMETEPAAVLTETEALVDWLEETDEAPSAELPELTLDADVESLWSEEEMADVDIADAEVIESELEAFVEGGLVPDEVDLLAEALDEEYERRSLGDEEEPDWYAEAVAQTMEAESQTAQEAPPEPPEVSDEPVLAEATPGDMPDWLQGEDSEAELSSGDDVPAWLSGQEVEAGEAVAESVPDWLADIEEVSAEADLGWLSEQEQPAADFDVEAFASEVSEPEVAAGQAPVEPPAEYMGVPAAPAMALIPEGELFARYRERLEADPNDHANRLALARALRTSQGVSSALDHYELLIDSTQFLQDVSADLTDAVEEIPENPRVRRLLGDTLMRQGKLQDALDAYRSALDRL